MSDVQLSTGQLKEVFSNQTLLTQKPPLTLQVTNLKPVVNDAGRRLRVILSDGVYTTHSVIRPEVVAEVEQQGIQKSSIVNVTEYEVERMSNGKHVVLIANLRVLQPQFHKIGGSSEQLDNYFTAHPEQDLLAGGQAPPQAQAQAQAPAYAASAQSSYTAPVQAQPAAPITRHDSRSVFAIEQLSPYQNTWTIKARVSYKSDIRTWSNQKGEGKLFNVNFLDETSEIRATAFNEWADKYSDLLQEGKVYYVSKARIQSAKPQFSNLKHPYELQLDRDTVIEECTDTSNVPKLHYNFVKLNQIEALEANSIIDIVGVIKGVSPAFQITSKAGKAYDRRDVEVVDDTGVSIQVGLWNKAAVDFSIPEGSVVAVKGAKVSDFQGKSLSITPGGSMMANPDTPESYSIKGWYDSQGSATQFKSLKSEPGQMSSAGQAKNRKRILDAQNENLGMSEKGDYFNIKGSVNFIKTDNFSYPACSSEGCSRKVLEQPDGTWRCEKCNMNHAAPLHRYIMTISVLDESGQLWLTLFNDQAEQLLGVTANELHMLKDNDPQSFAAVTTKVQMEEYDFRIRARQDNYNGTVRIRYQAMQLNKLDYHNEAKYLVEQFSKMKFASA